jgi:CrcB protein
LQRIAWLAFAGTLGTLARYWLGGFVQNRVGASFPWGTWSVNGLGCFLFGLVWQAAEGRALVSGEFRVVALTGFMGAFTTFSTYAFETSRMLMDSQWLLAAANFAGQNILGFALLFAGLALGKAL